MKLKFPRLLIFGLLFGAILLAAYLEAAPRARSTAAGAGGEARSAWSNYGLEINDTKGNTPQQSPKIASTAYGYHFMVWEDGRGGYTNIYSQKVDENGNRLWSLDGIAAGKGDGNQNFASLIEDGSGGLIVVWQDYRSGNADIYGQRINAEGTVLWNSHGVAVCKAAAGQFAPELISDGSGGAIITWHDYRSGSGEDVYAQRISADGAALWQEDGISVCAAQGTQWFPKIASDGSGGAIIVWTDGRASSADNNIYGQRISADGKELWEKDGISICSASQNQEKPMIQAVSGGAVVAWNDMRNGNLDIYANKIDLDGKALWQSDGVSVVSASFSQEDPKLADDGVGGAVVVWTDSRGEESAIYMQKISKDGQVLWGENGREVAKSAAKQEHAEIAKLGTEGWGVVWEDSRQNGTLLYAQKINRDGVPLWQEGGILMAAGTKNEEKPSVAVSPRNELMVVWQDKRNGNFDVYSQKISGQGAYLWGDEGNLICDAIGAVIHQNVNMIGSGGEVIMVFEDARSGYFNIYAQKITKTGTLGWGKDGIAVAKIKANQSNPQLISDGAGGVIVFWEDARDEANPKIFTQRISAAGKRLWENGSLAVCTAKSKQTLPQVVSDGAGGAIVVWQDERNALSYKDIYGQRISGQGELLWDNNGAAICTENGDQTEVAMITDGTGGAIMAWTDYRKGERNPDIYAQRVDKNGQSQWAKDGILVCGAPDVQRTPQIADDGEGGALIAWTDKGGGSYDIYGQRVNRQGQTMWLRDGIPVNQMPRTQQNPVLPNSRVVIWEDYRYGNWDIFANAVSPQGKLLWGDEGVAVVQMPLTQYAPKAVDWNGDAVVAWEDYRSGKQYEIYMQKINADGKVAWQDNGLLVKTNDGARIPNLVALPNDKAVVVVWEDYTSGGRAIFGQKFLIE